MPLSSRQIAAGIYGGHQPRDVAAAAALGVLAGALFGGNLSWTAVLFAAILINVHTRLFLATSLVSLWLSWLARGGLEDLGRWLLDGTPLGRAIGQLGEGVLPALLGWDQYALVGGLTAGAVAAIPAACAGYWLTLRVGGQTSHEVRYGPINHRALARLWFGGSLREQTTRQEMLPRLWRPCGGLAALGAGLVLAVAPWWLAASSAEREFLRQFSAYNGAEVSSGDIQLSLVSGEFTVHDLQIANPQRLDRDRLRIGQAKGRLSPGLLLRGHLDVEKLVLEQVRTDVARRRPARRCGLAAAQPETVERGELPPRRRDAPGDVEIEAPLRQWKTVCRQLGVLQELIAAVERLSRAEDIASGTAVAVARSRSQLGAPRPWVAVRQLRATDLAGGLNLGHRSLLELTGLSSNPALVKHAAELKIVLPKFGAELQLDFAANKAGRPTMRCSAYDVDLPPLIDLSRADPIVWLTAGRARLSGQGWFDRRAFGLRLLVDAQALEAEVAGRRAVAGIEPRIWNSGLKRLGALQTGVVFAGPWSSPKIIVNRQQLVAQFKGQLLAAGEQDLAAAIARQTIQTETGRDESAVLQVTALEPQVDAAPPGLCEYSDDIALDPAAACSQCENSDLAAGLTAEEPPQAMQYPTTSTAYEDPVRDDPVYEPPRDEPPRYELPAQAPPAAAAVRAPLPGPRNMAVGRDPTRLSYFDAFGESSAGSATRREGLLSRWTHGFRQRISQSFARPETPPPAEPSPEPPAEPSPEPAEPPGPDQVLPGDERMIPAAASEAWYNRRWR